MAEQSDFKATYAHYIRRHFVHFTNHIKGLTISVAHGNYHHVGACGAV